MNIIYYRWNPFKNHWEFRNNYHGFWSISVLTSPKKIDLKFYKIIELYMEDTWAEPTFDDYYQITRKEPERNNEN